MYAAKEVRRQNPKENKKTTKQATKLQQYFRKAKQKCKLEECLLL